MVPVDRRSGGDARGSRFCLCVDTDTAGDRRTGRRQPLRNHAAGRAADCIDGRWIVYESNQTGQAQIYVRPFPNVADALYQITSEGGRTPVWSPTGRELFFVNRTSMMVVPVQLTPFSAGTPQKLFDAPSMLLDGRFAGVGTVRNYDIARDGKRFLMIKESEGSGADARPSASMIVVQNWHEELKRLVPTR